MRLDLNDFLAEPDAGWLSVLKSQIIYQSRRRAPYDARLLINDVGMVLQKVPCIAEFIVVKHEFHIVFQSERFENAHDG